MTTTQIEGEFSFRATIIGILMVISIFVVLGMAAVSDWPRVQAEGQARSLALERENTRQREACESVGGVWLYDGARYICPVECRQ